MASNKTVCRLPTCMKPVSFIEKTTCICSKCNMQYCTLHRLSEAHNCNYNFKDNVNKEKFITDNKCVAEKIIKI